MQALKDDSLGKSDPYCSSNHKRYLILIACQSKFLGYILPLDSLLENQFLFKHSSDLTSSVIETCNFSKTQQPTPSRKLHAAKSGLTNRILMMFFCDMVSAQCSSARWMTCGDPFQDSPTSPTWRAYAFFCRSSLAHGTRHDRGVPQKLWLIAYHLLPPLPTEINGTNIFTIWQVGISE